MNQVHGQHIGIYFSKILPKLIYLCFIMSILEKKSGKLNDVALDDNTDL